MTVRERRPPLSSHPALNQIGRQRGKTIVVPLRAAILDRYIPRMKADRELWRWMIRLWADQGRTRKTARFGPLAHSFQFEVSMVLPV